MTITTIMPEYLTTRELAELLRIKERKVYDLAANGSVPCTRATGKLLFPKVAIDNWLAAHASGQQGAESPPRPNVILGSHDPLLEWALRESRCGFASHFDSSVDGLDRYAGHEGAASGLHLFDAGTGDWNVAEVKRRFTRQPAVLLEWARRRRGIVAPASRIAGLKALSDLAGRTVAPRQREAGSQLLLDHLLDASGIRRESINWTAPARSELDAVLSVLEGKADATFGLECAAVQHGLGFVPVIEERFDLLVDRRSWFEPAFQTLHRFCLSSAFKARAAEMPGYDISRQFRVVFNGTV